MTIGRGVRLVGMLLAAITAAACDDEPNLSGRFYDLVSIDGDPLPAIIEDEGGPVTVLEFNLQFAFDHTFFQSGQAEVMIDGQLDTLPLIGSGEYEIDGSRITLEHGGRIQDRFERGTYRAELITTERGGHEFRWEFSHEGIPGEGF